MERIIVKNNLVRERDIPQINVLLKQLSPKAPEVTISSLRKVMKTGNIFLAVDSFLIDSSTYCPGNIVFGMVTLAHARKPTAFYGLIEDVVVHENFRGRGLGRVLVETAIEYARELGMTYIDLSSNPDRIEGNKLYVSLGFQIRDSNCYRLKFTW